MITLPQFLESLEASQAPPSLIPGLKQRANRLWFDVLTDEVIRGIQDIWEKEVFQKEKKFIIYGAGTFLKDVFQVWPVSRYRHLLTGFVDRRYGQADFSDYPAPVFPPSRLKEPGYQMVVTFHPFAEQDMLETIKAHASEDVEIYLFYSSPPCRALLERETAKRIDALRARLNEIKGEAS